MRIATASDKDLLCRLLVSCGGTRGAMQAIARRIKNSDSLDLSDILGNLVVVSEPIREIVATCQSESGAIDAAGLVKHFSSVSHLNKMARIELTVAHELPRTQIPVAHTLLPLSLIGGQYYYVNGGAEILIKGLVPIGLTIGRPYAHLSGLIWIDGDDLWARTKKQQLHDGVVQAASKLYEINYHLAPKLRVATEEGSRQLEYLI